MKILVDRLTDSPTRLEHRIEDGWWRAHHAADRGLPEALAQPLEVRLDAHSMGDDVLVAGSVDGAFELECGRCLARYRHGLHEPLRLVLEPAGVRVPADPEGARALERDGVYLSEELESGWYRGPEIDLGAALLEVLTLALPVQPLCRDDCRGLCPRCGAELNEAPCGCPEPKTKSPFAVLEALRGDRRGEG